MSTAHWLKSSYSGSQGGNCVETAGLSRTCIGVRDSKDTARGHLTLSPAAWTALTQAVKRLTTGASTPSDRRRGCLRRSVTPGG
ncbi:DUF397 domain-containing protein [Yinghuangia aomiensis]